MRVFSQNDEEFIHFFPTVSVQKRSFFIMRKIITCLSKKRHEKKLLFFVCLCASLSLSLRLMSGVRTRAQKRRMGERYVWDLIVNNDDICFKHILPRLNSNDVKFLCGVNTETRKLVKRSSRAGDLKKKLKIEEMSSISTLEVRSRINRCGRVTCTTKDLLSAIKLLE